MQALECTSLLSCEPLHVGGSKQVASRAVPATNSVEAVFAVQGPTEVAFLGDELLLPR